MHQLDIINVQNEVEREIERQDAKWGDQRNLGGTLWMTILMEEVGEVAKDVLELKPELARKELIQVAALCFQMINGIDNGHFKS